MEEFLGQKARAFGFGHGVQNTTEIAMRLNAQGDAVMSLALADVEREAFERLVVEKRRIEWLSGRIAAKRAFARYMGALQSDRALSDIVVLNGRHRAPFVLGHSDVTLSISHSAEYAVAVAGPHSIGVDIERIEPRPLALASYFCCPEERLFLERQWQFQGERDVMLTRLWSRKEAVAKFLRLGGRVDFKLINTLDDYVCVEGFSDETIRLISEEQSGYCISLALRTESAAR